MHGPRMAVLLPLLVATAGSQEDPDRDPYTRGEPEALAAAGYTSLGPFPFGDGHGSADIDELLPSTRFHWVETAHFRIGSSLATARRPRDRQDQKHLEEELDRLRTRLPGVPGNVRLLDPWLRTHLYAQRMEEIYGEISRLLGVSDEDFPRVDHHTEMGRGPFLGRREKFGLLLFQKESDLSRYVQTHTRLDTDHPTRHYFVDTDNLVYLVAAESHRGVLKDPGVLHSNVLFATVLNLIDGYRRFDVPSMPVWFKEGLAHWYRRELNVKHNNFSFFNDDEADRYRPWEWRGKVFGRVRFEIDPSVMTILQWSEPWTLSLNDHAILWSRVDFLLQKDESGVRRFLDHVVDEPCFLPGAGEEKLREWYDEALHKGWGFDLAGFDREWHDWVLKAYAAASK